MEASKTKKLGGLKNRPTCQSNTYKILVTLILL